MTRSAWLVFEGGYFKKKMGVRLFGHHDMLLRQNPDGVFARPVIRAWVGLRVRVFHVALLNVRKTERKQVGVSIALQGPVGLNMGVSPYSYAAKSISLVETTFIKSE